MIGLRSDKNEGSYRCAFCLYNFLTTRPDPSRYPNFLASTRPVPKSKTPTRQTLLIGCSSSNSRDIDHGTPNWVLHNLAQVLWSSLSGDVDFNIQPAEAQLSRVMHIELWALAAPDCFSLSLYCIEYQIDVHAIITHFESCRDYWKSFWKSLGPKRASNENGAKQSGINKPDLCFLGFV